jgi:hypothetical protein
VQEGIQICLSFSLFVTMVLGEKKTLKKCRFEKIHYHFIQKKFKKNIYLDMTKLIDPKVAPLYQLQCYHRHWWNFEKQQIFNGLISNA